MSEQLKFSQEYTSYKPKEQKVYPIQETDWNKLKIMVSSCESSSYWAVKDIGLILIGGGISSLLSLIALYNSTVVVDWILNANWIILICSVLIGFVLLILDKNKIKKDNLDIRKVAEEMEHIEGKYYSPSSIEDADDKKNSSANQGIQKKEFIF